jgi:preprotein translocase SecE subunit
MATAVEPSSAASTPGRLFSLPVASLIGAAYTLAAVIAVVSVLPAAWVEYVSPHLGRDTILDRLCWVVALAAAVTGLVWVGRRLAGSDPPKGVHGGAFLMTCAAVTVFFCARAAAMWVGGNEPGNAGVIAAAATALVLGFFAARFFTGAGGERRMVGLEEQGWFSGAQYKRSLGVRVRRLTILGFLLVFGTGIVSLVSHGFVPDQWTLDMPFGWQPLTVMVGAKSGIPVLLAVAGLWFAFRAVNVPNFAEFLIATEAEMNKVSWSTRKRLAQDTVVVLVTALIMTVFLLVVDLFWGWLLSREKVGVLPSRSTGAEKGKAQEAKW